MTADDQYDVSGLLEAQFEPGSSGLVLKNLLGITSKEVMRCENGVRNRFQDLTSLIAYSVLSRGLSGSI